MVIYIRRYSSGHLIPNFSGWHDWIIGIKCPLEYLQVKVTTLVSWLWSLLTLKLLIFFFILFCLLFWEITIIISWLSPNYLLVENLLASTLRIHLISANYTVKNREQHEKHLYNQSSPYRKYGMLDHQSVCPSYWYKSRCATLTRYIATLCFASSSLNIWLTF